MKQRLSKRLSRTMALMTGLLLVIVLIICYLESSYLLNKQVGEKVQGALANTNGQIEKILTEQKVATEDFAWAVEESFEVGRKNPQIFYDFTRTYMEGHPNSDGMAIAFEPGIIPGERECFAPFTYRSGEADSLKTTLIGANGDYDYIYYNWYQIPKMLGKNHWVDPYSGTEQRFITSYSVPLYHKGEFIGVVVSDIDVSWVKETVDSLKILPYSRNFMISNDGRFVVNPFPNLGYGRHTIYTAIMNLKDSTALVNVARNMQAGKSGTERYRYFDKRWVRIYYAPLATTGWSTGMYCFENDLFKSTRQFFNILALMTLLSLTLLYFICRLVARHHTKPLEKFADATKEIAKGNFHVDLPDSHFDDEIHQLHDSTDYMQKSLQNYIEEVQNVTANKERVESELRIAHDIQMGMVPKIFPPFPNRNDLDLYATLTPAKEVGGDLYDFFIAEEKLYFIVGDVSGKGVPASLVMAVARSMFRTLAQAESDPGKILTQMNDSMSEGNASDMFVTAFAGVLNLSTGELVYCNGGHNAPMIVGPKFGEAYFLDVIPNLPVCTIGGFDYVKQSIQLKPGTTIFVYTDGLTEAENEAKELYGEDRLETLMKHEGQKKPREVVEDVLNSVHAHVRDAEQSDDLTVLVIKYL